MSEANIDAYIFNVIAFLTNILSMYFITWFSSKISDQMEEIGKVVYCSKWYTHPKSLGIYVLLATQIVQCPLKLSGLGIVHCNLETFTRVTRKRQNISQSI